MPAHVADRITLTLAVAAVFATVAARAVGLA